MDGLTVNGVGSVIALSDNVVFNVNVSGGTSKTSTINQRAKSSNGANAETSIVVTGSSGEAVSAWDFKLDTANGALTKAMTIDGSGDISFYEDTGTTAKFFWDSSAESLGIGTTPNAATVLHVQATEPQVLISDASLPLQRFMAFDVGLSADEDTHFITVDQADGLAFGEKLNGNDRVIENEWMRITNAGLVGISETDPKGLLHVDGFDYSYFSSNVGPATLDNEQGLAVGWNKSSGGGETVLIANQGAGATGGMAFATNTSAGSYNQRMLLDASGNLLVNGTNPTAKLVVDGDANAYTARFNSSTTGGQAFGTRIRAGTSSSDYALLVENTSAASMLAVRGDGNVGIGTSTPQASIHTTGDAIIGTATHGTSYEGVLQIADGAVNERTVVLIYNNHPDQFMKLGQDVNTAFIGRDQADEFAVGVFDNAADTTLSKQFVIDASGNVLIGKTSAAIAGAGTAILSSGTHNVTVDGDTTLQLNRLSSDGAIATFFKDGATVGSIGTEVADGTIPADLVITAGAVNSSRLWLKGGDSGLILDGHTNSVLPTDENSYEDNRTDLGNSNYRFKDLYLSGGVVFGATSGNVSSKTLDDYEEGTFTGAVADASSGGNESSSVLRGTYVKIGAVVYVQFNVSNISTTGMTAGNDVFITGLPFATKSVSGTAKYTGTANLSVVTFEQTPFMQVNEGETYVKILEVRSGAGNDAVVVSQLSSGASDIHGNLVYETA
jgi:hypothetical protein